MMAPTKSKLNPFAAVFVPGGTQASAASAAALPAAASAGASQQQEPDAGEAALFDIKELPMEMLSCIVSSLAGCGHDLSSCVVASQQLRSAVRAARVTYSLTEQQKQLLSNPANSCKLDELVHALTKYMPGMVSCSLSMLPLEHSHIASLAAGLQHLAVLDLSGCKKLQPSVTKLLQQHGTLPRLQCINLQRCFQLTEACLTDLVAQSCAVTVAAAVIAANNNSTCGPAAASRDDGKGCGDSTNSASIGSSTSLQCIALSHLNLANWPFKVQTNGSGAVGAASAAEGATAGAAGSAQAAAFWRRLAGAVRAALLHVPYQLDLSPMQLRVKAASAAATSSSLRAVVLNNCSHLSVEGLLAVAAACPKLEFLMLGGSTLKASWDSAAAAGAQLAAEPARATVAGAAEAAAALAGAGAYVPPRVAAAAGGAGVQTAAGSVAEALPAALQQLASMLELPAVLPWDELSACCMQQDGLACGQRPCSCCRGADCSSSAAAAVGAGSGQTGGMAKVRSQLHRNEPSAAAVAAARGHALALAYAVALLPELTAVEVTFMAPAVAGWLRVALQRLQQLGFAKCSSGEGWATGSGVSSSACMGGFGGMRELYRSCSSDSSSSNSAGSGALLGDGEDDGCGLSSCMERAISGSSSSSSDCRYPRVWEFTCIESVREAVQMLQECKRNSLQAASAGSGSSSSDGLNPACLETAVRCAANCSSRGRSTPVHTAAERGCAQHVQVLLQAGAAVAARDTSGASPLFVAAEAGRAATVEVLLRAGADPLVSNTAGETALYIAALRGHLPVVEVLLRHLSAAGVDWMQEGLYGDAWTPLMAAAVANRVDVALCLLRAANSFTAASSKLQQQLEQAGAGLAGLDSVQACRKGITYEVRYQNHAHAYHQQRRRNNAEVSSVGAAGVERLLAAENRYGQTALHIAARKGCRELLQLLLCYGALRVAGQVVDTAGDTWADVARRHGHGVALCELLQQC